jgi:demethylmenaquinone methyltransferase/2-methoxy-6-polyprenyl-1,4-benzoquinol methylase
VNTALQKIFGGISKTYELINHLFTFGLDILWRKKAVKIAAAGGGSMWLDICSGTGETAVYLKRLAPPGTTVVSADFCLPMLKEAAAKPDAKNIRFAISDATSLPFPDESFNLITVTFATRNLNTDRKALVRTFSEFHRVLKNGGRFVNLETSQPDSRLIRKLFHAYVGTLVRLAGLIISGSRSAYAYLARSIPLFYDARDLRAIMNEAGFKDVSFERLFFGAAAIHKAIK